MSKEVFISDAVSSIIMEVGCTINDMLCDDIQEEDEITLNAAERSLAFRSGSTELILHLPIIREVVQEVVLDSYHLIYEVSTSNVANAEMLYTSFLQLSNEACCGVLYTMFGERMKSAMKTNKGRISV